MDTALAFSRDMALAFMLTGFVIAMLLVERVRVDVTAVLVLVILGLTELVPLDHLFDGFSGHAVISIIAVMIMGAGLDRTGVLTRAAGWILSISGDSERRVIAALCLLSGLISAVMQNSAVVALFLPVAARLAARTGIPLARLLLPMACCVILGGTITMVGSSQLILLNDLIHTANRNLPPGVAMLPTLPMFAVAPIGLAALALGVLYFAGPAQRWLPTREDRPGATPASTESYFESAYGIRGDVHELVVTAESPLVGMRIGEAEALPGAPIVLALRTDQEARLAPPADELLWVGSVLGVLGRREEVQRFAESQGLRLLPRLRHFEELFNPARAGIAEAVVPPTSRFVGKRLGDLKLRRSLGISVLAIHRGDEVIREEVRETVLRPGDLMVLHSRWRDLAQAAQDRNFVLVTDIPKEEARPHKVPHALFFFALAIALALSGDVKLPVALLAGAVGMLLTGVLTMDEAYAAIGWKTVFLLAGLIPLGFALDATGAAAWLAQNLLGLIGEVPIWLLQAAVALLTAVLALGVTHLGAAVVMVPVAINLAVAAGGNGTAFALTAALAASANLFSASNPILALVTGPGGYGPREMWRAGGLLALAYLVLVLLLVNLLW